MHKRNRGKVLFLEVGSLAPKNTQLQPWSRGKMFFCVTFSVLCCQQQQQNSRRLRKMPQQGSRVIFLSSSSVLQNPSFSLLFVQAPCLAHTQVFFCQRRKKIRGEFSLQQSYSQPLRYKKQKMNETGFSALLVWETPQGANLAFPLLCSISWFWEQQQWQLDNFLSRQESCWSQKELENRLSPSFHGSLVADRQSGPRKRLENRRLTTTKLTPIELEIAFSGFDSKENGARLFTPSPAKKICSTALGQFSFSTPIS